MSSWFKKYRIRKAEEEIVMIAAEIKVIGEMIESVKSVPAYYFNLLILKRARKALLEFRIEKLKKWEDHDG